MSYANRALLLCLVALPVLLLSPTAFGVADETSSSGTGWHVGRGLIVTAEHVITDAKIISVIDTSGQKWPAEILRTDPANDIAVLKVDFGVSIPPALTIASDAPKLASTVFTVGFPLTQILGRKPQITSGEISGETGFRDDPRHFQISVPIQPGNSGGPLLNSDGEVAGMVVAGLNGIAALKAFGSVPQNVNFALRGSYIQALLASTQGRRTESPTRSDNRAGVVERILPAVFLVLINDEADLAKKREQELSIATRMAIAEREKRRELQRQAAEEKRRETEEVAARIARIRKLLDEEQRKDDEACRTDESCARERRKEFGGKDELDHLAKAEIEARTRVDDEQALDIFVGAYAERIKEQIERFTKVPSSLGEQSATVKITLLPTGRIDRLQVLNTSSEGYEMALMQGIAKAQPLPIPKAEIAFEKLREITLKFRTLIPKKD